MPKMHHPLFALCCLTLSLLGHAAETPAAPAEQVARGLLMQHDGKMIFAPCRERTYVQVEDVSSGGQVGEALLKLGLAENKPLYVEFIGQADADKLKAAWINFAHTEARCQATANLEEQWRAVGQDPHWSLRVGQNKLKLEEAGKANVEQNDIEVRTEDGQVRIAVGNDRVAEWHIRRQWCHGRDTDTLFGWRADLQGPSGQLHGCAWQAY
ncbi:MAG: hypothetical protein ACM3X0_01110 [Bacteroidota bacterium]